MLPLLPAFLLRVSFFRPIHHELHIPLWGMLTAACSIVKPADLETRAPILCIHTRSPDIIAPYDTGRSEVSAAIADHLRATASPRGIFKYLWASPFSY